MNFGHHKVPYSQSYVDFLETWWGQQALWGWDGETPVLSKFYPDWSVNGLYKNHQKQMTVTWDFLFIFYSNPPHQVTNPLCLTWNWEIACTRNFPIWQQVTNPFQDFVFRFHNNPSYQMTRIVWLTWNWVITCTINIPIHVWLEWVPKMLMFWPKFRSANTLFDHFFGLVIRQFKYRFGSDMMKHRWPTLL